MMNVTMTTMTIKATVLIMIVLMMIVLAMTMMVAVIMVTTTTTMLTYGNNVDNYYGGYNDDNDHDDDDEENDDEVVDMKQNIERRKKIVHQLGGVIRKERQNTLCTAHLSPGVTPTAANRRHAKCAMQYALLPPLPSHSPPPPSPPPFAARHAGDRLHAEQGDGETGG